MKPFQSIEASFLNITNEGLFMIKSPNDQRTKFYDYFLAEAKRLVEKHGDAPKKAVIEQICDNFYLKNKI